MFGYLKAIALFPLYNPGIGLQIGIRIIEIIVHNAVSNALVYKKVIWHWASLADAASASGRIHHHAQHLHLSLLSFRISRYVSSYIRSRGPIAIT